MEKKKNNNSKKIIIIIISICLLAGIGCVGYIVKDFWAKKVDGIKEFNYHYYGGWNTKSNVYYEITCDDKCIGNFNIKGTDYKEVSISDVRMNKLIKIINQYRVPAWDGFDGKYDITDAPSFGLNIKTIDGDTIKAEGYARFPRQHDKFRDELNKLFSEYDYSDSRVKRIKYVGKYEVKYHSDKPSKYDEYDKFYIDSLEEGDEFNKSFGTDIDFNKVDFDKYIVLMQYMRTGSGSNKFELDDVIDNYGVVELKIEEHIPDGGYGTDDMAYWYIGAIVNYDDVKDLNISDFKKVSNMNK